MMIRKTSALGKSTDLLRWLIVPFTLILQSPAPLPCGPELPKRVDEEIGNRHARRRDAKLGRAP